MLLIYFYCWPVILFSVKGRYTYILAFGLWRANVSLTMKLVALVSTVVQCMEKQWWDLHCFISTNSLFSWKQRTVTSTCTQCCCVSSVLLETKPSGERLCCRGERCFRCDSSQFFQSLAGCSQVVSFRPSGDQGQRRSQTSSTETLCSSSACFLFVLFVSFFLFLLW